jgi:hypothetical protein
MMATEEPAPTSAAITATNMTSFNRIETKPSKGI